MFSRRQFLKYSTTMAAGSMLSNSSHAAIALPDIKQTPSELAQNEVFWSAVRDAYTVQNNILNLEQGYWGQMSDSVQQAFVSHTKRLNTQMSWYVRKQYKQDFMAAREAVSAALGANVEEVMLTRNATESFVNLITQFNDYKKGDAIAWADIDYPSYQNMMQWLADSRNLQPNKLSLPASGTSEDYIRAYREAFESIPNLRLLLLTHVSNQHGLVMPVKEIISLAKQYDIYVICDCAQSWGLLDFTVDDINADWAIFNLHKWIGSPVGVGALFMRKGTLAPVSPFPGEEAGNNDVSNRVHLATSDFASFLTVPEALAFHDHIGGKNKEARLRHLWAIWTDALRKNPHVEILGAPTLANASGMGGFRLKGKVSQRDNEALQKQLERQFGIFTVVRKDLASGCNIRVTPQVFTRTEDMQKLVNAVNQITGL